VLRLLRSAALLSSLFTGLTVPALAQTPQLVFTAPAPEPSRSEIDVQAGAVVEERGLALWSGSASAFGVGVAVSTAGWTLRSISSMTALTVEERDRPTFQQVEVVRSLWTRGSLSVVGGGGVRQEWDGTQVFIGRVLSGSNVAGGRLQGSLVLEHAVSSPVSHDAADVVTSIGWSRKVGTRFSIGVEGIGQDLEGLWNRAEADGGAKLLVGPSLHAQSARGTWAANLTAGPVVQTLTLASPLSVRPPTFPASARHFGLFASASWIPSLRHQTDRPLSSKD
jgi:hypothetical protein